MCSFMSWKCKHTHKKNIWHFCLFSFASSPKCTVPNHWKIQWFDFANDSQNTDWNDRMHEVSLCGPDGECARRNNRAWYFDRRQQPNATVIHKWKCLCKTTIHSVEIMHKHRLNRFNTIESTAEMLRNARNPRERKTSYN